MPEPSAAPAPSPAPSPEPVMPPMAVTPNAPDLSTLLQGWQLPPPQPAAGASPSVPDFGKLLDGWKLPDRVAPSDVEIQGPPLMLRDSHLMEIPDRFQSSGRVSIDGDIVTQQLGRGHTAEYSLSQLSAHSKDPEYFANTLRYAAEHGDSVKLDVHHNVVRVTDPNLEAKLPHEIPYRDAILAASIKHNSNRHC